MKLNYESLIETCDQGLKAGNGQEVATQLENLNLSQVPRKWRRPLARLCRRAGLVSLGLKLLTPIAYPEKKVETDPTPEELVEYAALLNLNGATQEAIQILSSPQVSQVPEANLFRAFCCFGRWESAEAVPYLQKYLSYELDSYARLVGRVNLAAALVATRDSKSGVMLDDLISQLENNPPSRLQANCLELRAQVHLQNLEFEKAHQCLENAKRLLNQDNTFDRLFILKWTSISEALQTGSTGPLKEYQALALKNQEWEGVRESDLYLQKISFNENEFNHLYFGTPTQGYRERIRTTLGRQPLTNTFRFGPSKAPSLDIATGEFDGLKVKLSAGKKNHQLIDILLRDLYRPIPLAALFCELFPGEYFNVFSSPGRVHQTLSRVRKWIESNDLPIQITEASGRYSIQTSGPFAFHLPLERTSVDWFQTQLERFVKTFGYNVEFSAKEASEKLGLSSTSFLRWARWGIESNKVFKLGKGVYTSYVVRE